MFFVWYKFQHIEHNNTTLRTHFSKFITRARLTLVDDTTKWRSVKSLQHQLLWCTICCLKSALDTFAPSNTLQNTSSGDTIIVADSRRFLSSIL